MIHPYKEFVKANCIASGKIKIVLDTELALTGIINIVKYYSKEPFKNRPGRHYKKGQKVLCRTEKP